MSSHRGDGSVHVHRSGGTVSTPRALVVLLLACGLALALARPAAARGDDLEFTRRLVEVGYHDLARQVYEAILDRDGSEAEERDEARLGIALLPRERALHAARRGASYERLGRLVRRADEDLQAFALAHVGSALADRARLARGELLLTWAHWITERLREGGATATTARDDARAACREALDAFDALRAAPGPTQVRAAYDHAVALYALARLEPRGSEAARAGLGEADEELVAFLAAHDGELLAVRAQCVHGEVWRELAACEVDADRVEACLAKAVASLETCLHAPGHGPDHDGIVAWTSLHLARLALQDDPAPSDDLARAVLADLDAVTNHQRTLATTEDGALGRVEHARLVSRYGDGERALDLAVAAFDAARAGGFDAAVRLAHRTIRDLLFGPRGDRPAARIDPAILRRLADDAFALGELEEAIQLYRQVLLATPRTPEAFLGHRWRAWERIAMSYRRLDDRLGEALACEPIHEAWVLGWIPHRQGGRRNLHLYRAGNRRRAAQVAFEELADITGAEAFERREKEISSRFRQAYPDHVIIDQSPWNDALDRWTEALQRKQDGDASWRDLLDEAVRLLEGVTKDERSRKQDAAWVFLVRADYVAQRLPEAVETARKALTRWDGARARELAAGDEGVAARQREARGEVLYWMARSQLELGRPEEAVATLQGWHDGHPDLRPPYPELGYELDVQAHLAAGDREGADAVWETLLQRHPRYRRLEDLAFLLAQEYHDRRRTLHVEMRTTTEAWHETRVRRREAEKETDRLDAHRGDLASQLETAHRALAFNHSSDLLKEHVRELERRLRAVEASYAEWAARLPGIREAELEQRTRKQALEGELYEPLSRAAGYHLQWYRALVASGGEVDAETQLTIGAMVWGLAHLRPEETEPWETLRALYERFLADETVRARPATDPDVRLANLRLGIVYVRLAQAR